MPLLTTDAFKLVSSKLALVIKILSQITETGGAILLKIHIDYWFPLLVGGLQVNRSRALLD